MITCRSKLGYLLTVLTIAMVLVGCGIEETGVAPTKPIPSLMPLLAIQRADQPTAQPTPTPIVLGILFDVRLDKKAAPIEVPLKLKIPSLKVNAPVLGVGLTSANEMDAPKGPIDDPVWHTAFWYRRSGLPGESGTATIAGHVSDSLGREEIFTHLEDLHPDAADFLQFLSHQRRFESGHHWLTDKLFDFLRNLFFQPPVSWLTTTA